MAITLNGTTGVTTTGLTSNGIDDNATSTAMTLDTSGNLLVGKTTTAFGTQGARLSSVGTVIATSSGNAPAELNRLTSDGDIAAFYKDSTKVGSIGTLGNRMSIGTGDVGLFFNDQTDQIQPINTTTNAPRDNAITLGAIDRRFKDLYLSGGVYLGGTGAANHLDDYEEGTWTPSFTGLTIGNGAVSGTYTKIGRQVTVVFGFDCGSTTSVGTLGNITGLPFASANNYIGYVKVHGVAFDSGSRWYEAVAVLGNNSTTIYVPSITNYNSSISSTNPMPWTTNDTLVFTATYTTA